MPLEHKIVTGGDQWLPFARSRIKALRATGLAYASQQYEIDGASVKVRIVPGQDYIAINGGVEILSGVVRNGLIVELPAVAPATGMVRAAEMFRPTDDCQEKVMHQPLPAMFGRAEKLAVEPSALVSPESPGDAQTAAIGPSMYSGRMQKAVQYLLGTVRSANKTAKVTYGYQWHRTHIITKSDTGKDYLVELSRDDGVRAMRLPCTGSGGNGAAAKEVAKEFKRAPTGQGFPTGEALADALASGSVAQLLTAEELGEFYAGRSEFSLDHGWTTNTDGTEAHIVGIEMGPGTQVWASHHKLTLPLVEKTEDSPPNTPCVSAECVLAEVSRGRICWGGGSAAGDQERSYAVAWEHAANGWKTLPAERIARNDMTPTVCDTTVFVYFHEDELREVAYQWDNVWRGETSETDGPVTAPGVYTETGSSTAYIAWPDVAERGALSAGHTLGTRTRGTFTTTWVSLMPVFATALGNPEYTSEVTSGATRRVIPIFPRGLRNGWVRATYDSGDVYQWRHATAPNFAGVALAGSYHLVDNPALYWSQAGRFDHPEGGEWVSGWFTGDADNLGTIHDIITRPASKVALKWLPTDEASTLTDSLNVALYAGGLLELDTMPAEEFLRWATSPTETLTDGMPARMMWHADSTYTNNVRSDSLRTIAPTGLLVEGEEDGASYSFVGYTGMTPTP